MPSNLYINSKYAAIVAIVASADVILAKSSHLSHDTVTASDGHIRDLLALLDTALDYYAYTHHIRWIIVLACIMNEIEEIETGIDTSASQLWEDSEPLNGLDNPIQTER